MNNNKFVKLAIIILIFYTVIFIIGLALIKPKEILLLIEMYLLTTIALLVAIVYKKYIKH